MATILNLGCGTRTSAHTVDIDWSIYQRLKANPVGRAVMPALLSAERRDKFLRMDDNIIVHDLRKGIPVAEQSADAVYHSHVLEHIDREAVPKFFGDISRVLRPGGVHRIVVPDLERYARAYLASLESGVDDHDQRLRHDTTVAAMISQMVRREAFGTSQQPHLRRRLENVLLGDARRRGETHMWMWDRVNLRAALESAGFIAVTVVNYRSSQIPGWEHIGLDVADDRVGEYKPGSLYVEARRPEAPHLADR
jgi:SAM-dependent methyltransferase